MLRLDGLSWPRTVGLNYRQSHFYLFECKSVLRKMMSFLLAIALPLKFLYIEMCS